MIKDKKLCYQFANKFNHGTAIVNRDTFYMQEGLIANSNWIKRGFCVKIGGFVIEIFVQSDDFDKVGLIVSFNKIDLLAVGQNFGYRL